jgi:hypothetical protein
VKYVATCHIRFGLLQTMLLDRVYTPADNEMVYHYCSAEAFLGIISSRTMWLSAHYLLNDSTERDWGYSIFQKATKQLEGEVGKTFIDNVTAIVNIAYSNTIVMIGCYSLDADVLSQWVRYADNGRGFAIGFSPQLFQMPAKRLRVLYDEDLQIGEMLGNLRHTHKYETSIGFRYDDKFQSHWYQVGLDLCAYKNPAFKEEKEIRLAHISGLIPEGQSAKLLGAGARGTDGKRLSRPLKINFRVSNGILVPYVALDYSNKGAISPIKEVIIGPRNENAKSNVEVFLNTTGVKDVTVRRSDVPVQVKQGSTAAAHTSS